ncbi:MAG: RsmF rRNA methyltransferase first C-terminal domain-containing protein [Candidatus Coproplasma sp.]
MIELPAEFVDRIKNDLKDDAQAFLASYDRQPYKAIRINTLKISVQDFKKISPFVLSQVAWEPNGFYVTEEKAGKTVFHAAGLYYVQEPSAMSAAPLLSVQSDEKVLDLCSAPGGKGTQLAQALKGEGLVVLNEIDYSRAKILSRNVERLGIKNAVVTCASPEKIAKAFGGYFDKVLVDAPCSGEGMFLKEPNAVTEWSEKNVELCAARQKGILECAQSVLKTGGLMVYSTCTFAPKEDELQVEEFLNSFPDFSLIKQHKLLPHEVMGEGHFVALLQKNGGDGERKVRVLRPQAPAKKIALYRDFESRYLKIKFDNLHMAGDELYSLPNDFPQVDGLQIMRAGVPLGEFKGERFEPSHSLAMCLKCGEANCIEVDEQTAIDYLKGLTFSCDESKSGWNLVTYFNYPLGWCKAVNGTAKNHLPKGIRI